MDKSDMIVKKYIKRANKIHTCGFCGKEIRRGESFERIKHHKACDIDMVDTCCRCTKYVEEAFSSDKYGFWRNIRMSNDQFHYYMWKEHKGVAEQWWGVRDEINVMSKHWKVG